MAYALKGCGVMCQSDLIKRDIDAHKHGRRPVPALSAPFFLHSRRFFIGEGAFVSSVNGFPENPELDACLEAQRPVMNQRVFTLKTVAEIRNVEKMQEEKMNAALCSGERDRVRMMHIVPFVHSSDSCMILSSFFVTLG